MEKQYKLKKSYPGSPKIGTILEKYGKVYKSHPHTTPYLPSEIECNSEFWEIIKSKCPEFKYTPLSTGITRLRDGAYFNIGQRIRTPVSNSVCFIYDLKVVNGEAICENTHSYLLNQAELNWLDVAQPCEYSKVDMISFAHYCTVNHNQNINFLFDKWNQ